MYKIPHYVPIVFHNLSRHDAHLFIRELGKKFDTGKIGVIAENKEKYISFNVDVVVDTYEEMGEVKEKIIQLRFIDSIRFMASSLNSSMNNLVVQYLDANNLYGWAISQKHLTRGFNWVDPSQFTPDEDTKFFNTLAGVLQGDALAPYLFAIVINYTMRQAVGDQELDLEFKLDKRSSR